MTKWQPLTAEQLRRVEERFRNNPPGSHIEATPIYNVLTSAGWLRLRDFGAAGQMEWSTASLQRAGHLRLATDLMFLDLHAASSDGRSYEDALPLSRSDSVSRQSTQVFPELKELTA